MTTEAQEDGRIMDLALKVSVIHKQFGVPNTVGYFKADSTSVRVAALERKCVILPLANVAVGTVVTGLLLETRDANNKVF